MLAGREFPPAEHRNHNADQYRDRTDDGPGRGVAHRATTKHSESLERPDQTEQRDNQPERKCGDESPSHTGMLAPEWDVAPCPTVGAGIADSNECDFLRLLAEVDESFGGSACRD